MTPTQKYRHTAIDTDLQVDGLLMKSFSGREELGRLFSYHIVLLDPKEDVDPDRLIGTGLTVRLELENSGTRYFNGFMSTLAFAGYEDGAGVYHAEVVPWAWLLTRTSDCRCFQEKTVQQILEEVFRGHGFNDFEFHLTGTYKPRVFCVQYNETDFNFVSRLMEHEGMYYFFRHENGKHTMVIMDDMASHEPHPTRPAIEYHRKSGVIPDGYLYDMTFQKTVSTGGYATNDYDFKKPKEDLRSDKKQEKRHAGSKFEIFEFPGSFRDKDEGKKLSKVRVEEIQSGHETINAHCTARGLACGYLFELKKAERKDQEREYLITSTTISIISDAFTSGGTGGGDKFTCEITALPKSTVFRPARVAQKPVMRGPQTALVTGPPGEEIHCDEHGRVKVHFYWDRYSKADEKSSKWVRVSNASAGGGYGFLSLPRIGQEVLVEYIDGDPDRPVITGRLYNGDNKPPYALPADKNRCAWKSNTTKGGGGFNEIRMDDTKDREQIFMHSQRDMDIRVIETYRAWIGTDMHTIVGNDVLTETAQDEHHTIGRHHITTVGTHRNATVGGNDVTRVGSDHQVAAGANARLEAGIGMELTAGSTAAITAGTSMVINAGASLTLAAGSGFITIDASGVTIQGTMVRINSGGAKGPATSVSKKDPESPKKPKEACNSGSGKVEQSKGMGHATNPQTWRQKTVHDIAHQTGQPFVVPERRPTPPPRGGAGGGSGGGN